MEVIILEQYIEALVSSESTKGSYYRVTKNKDGWECSCPCNQLRKIICKHIKEAQSFI